MTLRISTFLLPALAFLATAPLSHAQSFSFTIGGNDANDEAPVSKDPYPAKLRVRPATLKPGQPYSFTVMAAVPSRAAGSGLALKGPGGEDYTSQDASFSYSNENGKISFSANFNFSATAPTTPGDYRFPAQTVELGAVKIAIPETVVTVRKLAAGESVYSPASIRLEVPPGEYVAGQEIDATLVFANSRDEVIRHLGALTLSGGEDFSVSRGAMEEGSETIDGTTVPILRMKVKLRANSSGEKSLAMNALVIVAPADGGTAMSKKLSSPPVAMKIVHAPQAGKPASYAGAVGRFSVSPPVAAAAPRKSGEPFRISFFITGEGSLDRVASPELAAENWACKAESPVTLNRNGSLVREFVYLVTPAYGGDRNTPSGEFSWYDPVERAYKRVAIPGLRVAIEGPEAPAGIVAKAAQETPVLAADPAPSGKSVGYATVVSSDFFTGPQLVLAGLITVLAVLNFRSRRLAANPARRTRLAARRDLRRHRNSARRALAKNDFAAFGEHARAALRAGVSPSAHANAGALTAEETLAALPVDEAARLAIAPLFDAETAARFAGETAPPANPANNALFTTLVTLEKSLR